MDAGGISYPELLTETEYLRVEEAARERNEYIIGRMYAMTGATIAHEMIIGNLYAALRVVARRRGCRAHTSNVKLKIESLGCFYYPDVTVTCEPVFPFSQFISAPSLIIEVLSSSTESIDRREKMMAYYSIGSLVEYAIAHQDKPLIEVYKRSPEGGWIEKRYEGEQAVVFESLGGDVVEISLAEIYDF